MSADLWKQRGKFLCFSPRFSANKPCPVCDKQTVRLFISSVITEDNYYLLLELIIIYNTHIHASQCSTTTRSRCGLLEGLSDMQHITEDEEMKTSEYRKLACWELHQRTRLSFKRRRFVCGEKTEKPSSKR